MTRRYAKVSRASLAAAAVLSTLDACCVRADGEPRPPSIVLAVNGRPTATIVCGERWREVAAALSRAISSERGHATPVVLDRGVVKANDWRIADEWIGRPLILLGSIYDNRVLVCLAARRFVACNSEYPGRGRYELRTLFAPLRANADLVVVGASDEEGMRAGLARLLALLVKGKQPDRVTLSATIEVGRAAGPIGPPSWTAGDPGRFVRAVERYYWYRRAEAAQCALRLLRKEMAAAPVPEGLWRFRVSGHYSWESHWVSLRQLIASGYLPPAEVDEINRRLVAAALRNEDGYGRGVLTPRAKMSGRWMNRHYLSSLSSQYVLYDYLVNVARFAEDEIDSQAAKLRRGYEVLLGNIQKLIDNGVYRNYGEGYEGQETMGILAGLYWYIGDGVVLDKGVFPNMARHHLASRDNFGSSPGIDSYLDTGSVSLPVPGGEGVIAAAFFHRDPQCVWLRRNTRVRFGYLGVPSPPGMFAPPTDAEARPAQDCLGLTIVPLHPEASAGYQALRPSERVARTEGSPEDWFSKAAFRDGFDRDSAFLLLVGDNYAKSPAVGIQANAIVRYTELGSLLLYQNTAHETSWQRSVVSVSRGRDDPQSVACRNQAWFRTPQTAGIASVMNHNGGTRWTRNIVHRSGAYFAVVDVLTAREDDHYGFVCRWRSYHQGRMADGSRFVARDKNGVRLHIVQGTPARTTVVEEPRDGASEPVMVRQWRSARLRAGESVSFQNLLYAASESDPREFHVRRLADTTLLIRGSSNSFKGTDLVCAGPVTLPGLLAADAELSLVSRDQVVLAGCRRAELPGHLRMASSQPVTLTLLAGAQQGFLRVGASAPVTVDCRPSEGAVSLMGGTHQVKIADQSRLWEKIAAQLDRAWDGTSPPRTEQPVEAAPKGKGILREVGTIGFLAARKERHRNIRAKGEPPARAHGYWTDRNITTGWGYGGWDDGKGTILIDLCEPVNVAAIKLIWPHLLEFRRRNERSVPLRPDEVSVAIAVGSDSLGRREGVPGIHYMENQPYMYTRRFQCLTIPVGLTAQFLRLEISPRVGARQAKFLIDEIQIVKAERADRAHLRMAAIPNTGRESVDLAVWSRDELLLANIHGGVQRKITLDGPIVDLRAADVDSDGQSEAMMFPLTEAFTVFNADGKERFKVDLYTWGGGPGKGSTSLRPACITAWRPDRAVPWQSAPGCRSRPHP